MYNLHKIILLYINEMFKLKINNSKPKDWPRIPLIIYNQTEVLIWIHDTRSEAKLISTKFLMLGDDLSVWDFLSSMTFPWLLMIFQSSMTFPENFIFPGFPDPVGTLTVSQKTIKTNSLHDGNKIHAANESGRYFVMMPLTGWAQT